MLNKSPVFMNGFSFGGTNLLMNLLASHPEVSMLSGETHEVFFSKPNNKIIDKAIRRFFYFPVRLVSGQDIFGKWYFEERKNIPKLLMHYIDLIFYIDKITTSNNEFKYEDVKYEASEIRNSRFFTKNMNGVVFACKRLSEIYPDATFISLIRNGFALCEGYVRRGWKADKVGKMYNDVCQQMVIDSQSIPNYHIVRFEDMVSAPVSFMKTVYSFAGLDMNKVRKVRLQAKRSMDKDGTRRYTFGGSKDRETHWFNIEELNSYVRKDVNDNQSGLLSDQDRNSFLEHASKSMKHFGYI